jgi:hypothetical protein
MHKAFAIGRIGWKERRGVVHFLEQQDDKHEYQNI